MSRKNARSSSRRSKVREVSDEELMHLIDERSRFLLGISGDEFMQRYERGELGDGSVEAPIRILADLVRPR